MGRTTENGPVGKDRKGKRTMEHSGAGLLAAVVGYSVAQNEIK